MMWRMVRATTVRRIKRGARGGWRGGADGGLRLCCVCVGVCWLCRPWVLWVIEDKDEAHKSRARAVAACVCGVCWVYAGREGGLMRGVWC